MNLLKHVFKHDKSLKCLVEFARIVGFRVDGLHRRITILLPHKTFKLIIYLWLKNVSHGKKLLWKRL